MWIIDIFSVILAIAEEWCSWRLFVCIGIAIGIVAGFFFAYPEQPSIWYVSVPAAFIVIGLGFLWQIHADRK